MAKLEIEIPADGAAVPPPPLAGRDAPACRQAGNFAKIIFFRFAKKFAKLLDLCIFLRSAPRFARRFATGCHSSPPRWTSGRGILAENIKKYPDPILRKKAKEVEKIDEEIKKISADMAEALKESGGKGLAGPQVGVSKRIIAVLVEENKIETFINPKLIKKSIEKEIEEEGCLSFPGIFLKIKRPSKITIQTMDLEGRILEIEAEGILARVFQHEIDHLDGILFIDRLNFWQRWKIKRKLKRQT